MTEQFGAGFEGLEDRTLLAANVSAVLSNGTLTITGATSGADVDDLIYVYGDGTLGNVTLDVNGAALKVNGATDSDGLFDFTGVKNIVFNGGAGEDTLYVYDLNISGYVKADGGADYDYLFLQTYTDDLKIGGGVNLTGEDMQIWTGIANTSLTIGKGVVMNGGAGNDYMYIYTYDYNTDIFIGGNVVFNGGAGSDYMEVSNYYSGDDSDVSTVNIGGNVTVNGGGGTDYGLLVNYDLAHYGEINVGGGVEMFGGAGKDFMGIHSYGYGSSTTVVGNVRLEGGTGNDRLGITSHNYDVSITVGGNVTMKGNDGIDNLGLFTSSNSNQVLDINGKVTLEGDKGDDTIYAFNDGLFLGSTLEVGSVEIQGWDGKDTIGAAGVNVVGKAAIWGGNGNDDFFFANNSVGAPSFINGWFGADTLVQFGNTGPITVANIP